MGKVDDGVLEDNHDESRRVGRGPTSPEVLLTGLTHPGTVMPQANQAN